MITPDERHELYELLVGPLGAQLLPERIAHARRLVQLVHEKAMFAPIWQLAAMGGFGPRVEESGLGLITGFPFSGPYEDVKLKGK